MRLFSNAFSRQNLVLPGANPSPEDEPEQSGGGDVEMVLNIQAYQNVEPFSKPNKKEFEGYIKGMSPRSLYSQVFNSVLDMAFEY